MKISKQTLDEEYYKLGSERLERIQSQISMFDINPI